MYNREPVEEALDWIDSGMAVMRVLLGSEPIAGIVLEPGAWLAGPSAMHRTRPTGRPSSPPSSRQDDTDLSPS